MVVGQLSRTFGTLIVVSAAFSMAAQAQPASPTPPPPSPAPIASMTCSHPATSCHSTFAFGNSAYIKIEPNGASCQFDTHTVDDMETYLGMDAKWTFCSTCTKDTRVQLEDATSLFGKFMYTTPPMDSANQVTVEVPANCYADITAHVATATHPPNKYNFRLLPAGIGTDLDFIDPTIEIDNPPPFDLREWLLRILALVLGVVLGSAGGFMARRARLQG